MQKHNTCEGLCVIISGNIMIGGKYRNITHVSVLCGIISGNLMSVEVNTET